MHEQSLDRLIGDIERVEMTLPSGRTQARPSWWRETTEDDVLQLAHRLKTAGQ